MIKTPTMYDILYKEFMEPMNISAYKLAKDIMVPVSRIQDILHNRRRMTVDTSIRLGKYFGVSEKFFIDIQDDIDIRNIKASNSHILDKIQRVNTKHNKINKRIVGRFNGKCPTLSLNSFNRIDEEILDEVNSSIDKKIF